MGLCQFFDTIPASVDETEDKFLHLLIGPCPSRCYIAVEKIIIYKTSIIMAVNC